MTAIAFPVAPPPSAVFVRRRVAALAIVLALLAGLFAFGTALGPGSTTVRTASAHGATAEPPPALVYVVQPGDTLWSIAATIRPDDDVRDTVDQLVELNGGAAVQAGQRLTLP